jgi:hypothetical protein
MNPPMNMQEPSDPVEVLLREQAAYINDNGFTRRVLHALPRRRRPLCVPILLGSAVACALSVWWFPTDELLTLANLDFSSMTSSSVAGLAAALVAIGSVIWSVLTVVKCEC